MELFRLLTSNYIINVGFVAWFGAQILKILIVFLFTKEIQLERFVGAGGMPSSHSALTTSVAIAMARVMGFSSPEFALALVLAVIVMYDAMGVRRAAGEQAKVLNRIVFEFPFFTNQNKVNDAKSADEQSDEKPAKCADEAVEVLPLLQKQLKEFLGHTPLEVLGGILVGILAAVLIPIN